MASKQQGSKTEGKDASLAGEAHALPPATRGGFRKGALLAALLIVPGLSALLHQFAQTPLARSMAFDEVIATVAVFAGLPALLVFGGIGKNLARQRQRERLPLVLRGSLLGSLAGTSLALLAAVPTATLPGSLRGSLPALGAVALLGAATGGLLGLWIHFSRGRATLAGAKGEA